MNRAKKTVETKSPRSNTDKPIPESLRPRTLTAADFAKLSREEQMLEAAKANLLRYGTLTPPPEALIELQVHVCPRCGHEGPVKKDFGTKVVRGVTRIQSWCRECRNSTASHPSRNGL
jgi:hypothetical protein